MIRFCGHAFQPRALVGWIELGIEFPFQRLLIAGMCGGKSKQVRGATVGGLAGS
jgi:hypothetical protein